MKNLLNFFVFIFASCMMFVHSKDVVASSIEEWHHNVDSVIISNNFELTWIEDTIQFIPKVSSDSLMSVSVISEETMMQPRSVTSVIDYTKPVGSIPFQSDVSPMGARIYQVPIEVYPGLNGFTPQLGLSYNSMQGNGVAGVGWGISGLSNIIRTNKSIYYDGYTDGISSDHESFTLDGIRLIRIADENGLPCYQTVQGHIKARATSLTDGVITGFHVYYPNGNLGHFQALDAGRLVYPMVSLTNSDGYSINYSYYCSNNQHYLGTVSYNYNADAKVIFSYEERPDIIKNYVCGYEVKQETRLKKITVKLGSTILREYNLAYESDEAVSLLAEIGYSAGGESLNPLKLQYGDGMPENNYSKKTIMLDYANITAEPKHNKHSRIVKGKFDYTYSDGILSFTNKNPYTYAIVPDPMTGIPACMVVNRYGSNSNDKIYVAPDLEHDNSRVTTLPIGSGFVDALCMDITGSQEDYIVRINNNKVNNIDQVSFSVFRYSNELDTCSLVYPIRTYDVGDAYSDVFSNKSLRPKHFRAGDFNGDGKQEIMVIICQAPLYDASTTQCKIYDIENNSLIYSGTPFSCNAILPSYWGEEYTPEQIEDIDRLFVMDYNGDGKSDICLINANGINMYEFETIGTEISSCKLIKTVTDLNRSILKNRYFLLGEFNGDGLVDFILSPKINNSDTLWKIYSSKGNGEFTITTFTGPKANTETCDDFIIQDVNCDGKSDLIECHKEKFITFINKNGIPNVEVCTCSMDEKSAIVPTNITSHNFFSHVLTLKNDKLVKHSFLYDMGKQQLLTSIKNSLCNEECTIYKYPYDDGTSYHVRMSDDITYPYVILREKIPFVTSSYEKIDGSNLNSNTYYYENLVMHHQGLGLCGMEKVVTNGERFVKIQEFDPILYGVHISDTIKTKVENNLVSSESFTYDIIHPNDDNQSFIQINVNSKLSKDYIHDCSTTTTYSYNEYGFPISEISVTSDGVTIYSSQSVNHHVSSTHYMLNVVKEKTVTTERNGQTHTEKVTFPTMYFNKPLTQYNYVNGEQVNYETYAYGTTGGLVRHTTQNYSSDQTLTTTYEYDNYGRVVKETTPEGLTKITAYNSKGQVASYTDEIGNTTTYTYDALGIKIQTNNSDGTWEKQSYSWHQGEPLKTFGYTLETTSSKGGKTTEYYDTRQQLIGIKSLSALSELLVYNTYDDYGNKLTETLPFKEGGTRYYNRYTYDDYDRLTELLDASGKITSYSYNGNKVTTLQDGITTTRTYDSQGNIIEVKDSAGVISYVYRPDGQPASVTAPGGFTTTMEYDSYGRQTKLIDPSCGTTTFTYDAAGNIASKTDGAGRQTLIEYDVYGRPIRKEYVGTMYVTYTYNDRGLLSSEMDSNGGERNFSYDTYGRLSSDFQSVGATDWNLTRNYMYDSNGNLASIEYSQEFGPSAMHYGTEKFVYQNGQIKKISFQATPLNNAESIIWEVTSENDHGIPSSITSGSLSHSYTYDLQGNPLQMRTTSGNTTIRDVSYTYDSQTGNLMSRIDNTRNLQEIFTYDHQNRLTGDGIETYVYENSTGNMIYNSRVGTITYGNGYSNSYKINLIDPLSKTSDNLYLHTRQQKATYNAMSRLATLMENNLSLEFTYNGRCERNISKLIRITPPQGMWSDTVKTEKECRYNLSNLYERYVSDSENRVILYLGGDAYSAPAAFVKDNLYGTHIVYICRDHQGSITHLRSNLMSEEYSYDAWGNLRNPKTQEVYPSNINSLTSLDPYLLRGYTGHEHLSYYGLINMNARLYEPITGRFISADPFIQMPDYSQNFNRYTYCLNNPLKYTDPNGEWFLVDDLIAIVAGGTINLVSNAIQGNIDGNFFECIGKGFAAFGAGGIAGWGGLHPELGGWAWGGAVAGATNAWLGGATDAKGILIGSVVGVTSSGLGVLGGSLGQQLGSIIVNGTNIVSPALSSTIIGTFGGFTGGYAGGFAVGAMITGNLEQSLDIALDTGTSGALTGAISGFTGGIKYARDHKISPWTGEKVHYHHSYPKFLGGENDQILTPMSRSRHWKAKTGFHQELNEFLKTKKNDSGNMVPSKGNDGKLIKKNVSSELRFNAIKEFYDANKLRYWDARFDFYRNNKLLWKPW